MNIATLKNDLIEKINNLSEDRLKALFIFAEYLENREDIQTFKTDEERIALADRFNNLCRETQDRFTDNPMSAEEIQAEIDAYRRGE
jgi:hypothetical protein